MGPLVPEIFSQDFNFVIALIIGFFFGFILEQAGFSSSKKLAGLFYGYDFVVLKVFFTAGVTAMLGILFMGNIGMLDLSEIYVHPTYFYSAIIGGAIMGLGFIIGGFCPGTSIVAATTGKIDAIVFVLGGAIGIFIFGEIYPSIETVYKGSFWGNMTAADVLGISPGIFAFLLTTLALLAFIFTQRIENKVNKVSNLSNLRFIKNPQNIYVFWGIAFVLFSFFMIFMESYSKITLEELTPEKVRNMPQVIAIEPMDLAYRIIDYDETISLIDIRDEKQFKANTLPGAENIKFENLFTRASYYQIRKIPKAIVFIDNDGINAHKAAGLAVRYGKSMAYYLNGGLKALSMQLSDIPKLDSNSLDLNKVALYKFKISANEKMQTIAKQIAERKAPPKDNRKKSAGGC